MLLTEQFMKDNIIENLSIYEARYQIALGKIIHETKVSDISYELDFKLALGSIYELIKDIQDLDYANKIFQEELEKQIYIDALQFFVNEHYEKVKTGTINIENLLNEINDNRFFNEEMGEIYNQNIFLYRQKYQDLISDELAFQIFESVKELQN